MSYYDFVQSLKNGVSLFYDSLVTISNYLMSNYIFITLIGIIIFISLFTIIVDLISLFSHKNKNNNDYN